jgi:hypothetical protein
LKLESRAWPEELEPLLLLRPVCPSTVRLMLLVSERKLKDLDSPRLFGMP